MTRLAVLACLLLNAAPAHAAEVFAGLYKHDVDLFTKRIAERGTDMELGYRHDPVARLGPRAAIAPYALVSINTAGGTDFAAAGLGLTYGNRLYLRPGLALAVHDGPRRRYVGRERVDLGSRILFEPELALGWRIAPRLAIEASYTHLSHARIFSRQNPGLDMLGVRLAIGLR